MIQGDGSSLAPDLTKIGSRMTATQINQTMLHPPVDGKKFMPAYNSVAPEDLKLISNYLYQLR